MPSPRNDRFPRRLAQLVALLVLLENLFCAALHAHGHACEEREECRAHTAECAHEGRFEDGLHHDTGHLIRHHMGGPLGDDEEEDGDPNHCSAHAHLALKAETLRIAETLPLRLSPAVELPAVALPARRG